MNHEFNCLYFFPTIWKFSGKRGSSVVQFNSAKGDNILFTHSPLPIDVKPKALVLICVKAPDFVIKGKCKMQTGRKNKSVLCDYKLKSR